jgi:hypothetical protein
VVPLTTMKGAGHNPGQALVLALRMTLDVEDYVLNPHNVQAVQNALTKKITEKNSRRVPYGGKFGGGKPINFESLQAFKLSPENHVLRSHWKNKPRFNGFVFAVNMTGVREFAHSYPNLLFNPSNQIIGQEDDFISKGVAPKISLGAFVFHFKSQTVKMSRNSKNEDTRGDMR